MTLHPDDELKSKGSGSTTGKAPLCQVCHVHIYGFIVTRRGLEIEFSGDTERSKRFAHRRYHPTCSDRIRRRAACLLRKRGQGA